MHFDVVPNRNSPPAVLLRESYREGNKVRKRTLANLSHLPPEQIEGIRQVLKGAPVRVPPLEESFEIERSLPHGHVSAVLGKLRQLGLERLIAARGTRQRALAVALIVARVLDPRSKLATARALSSETVSGATPY